MQLRITGPKINKALRKELREACRFFSERLINSKLRKNIQVDIYLVPNLLKEQKAFGWCTWVENNLRPRIFEIDADADLSRVRLIRTLAHEMVHVKQFASGELKDYIHKETHWCGRRIDPRIPYRKKPWEEEAFRLQNELCSEWLKLKRDEKRRAGRVDK
jgi:hypothetical protein